jgi:hypothetical protein
MATSVATWESVGAPPEIAALGPPEKVFSEVSLQDWWQAVNRSLAQMPRHLRHRIGLALLVVGLLAMVTALCLPYTILAILRTVVFMTGFLATSGGVLYLVGRLPPVPEPTPATTYALYPDGVACFEGGTWTLIRWSDVVEHRGQCPGAPFARVVLRDGRKLTLRKEGIRRGAELLRAVECRTLRPRLDQTLAALDAGQTVWFDPLGVGKDGLHHAGKTLAWEDLDRIEVASPLNAGVIGSLNVRLLIRPRAPQCRASLLGGSLEPSAASWWLDLPFLHLPDRAVLLTILEARRPGACQLLISGALSCYMPWNPNAAHSS